jgi:hypothetical protein
MSLAALVMQLFGPRAIREEICRGNIDATGTVDFIDATGDMLRYFFSLVPPEVLDDHTDHPRVGKSARASSY